jgi:hypothetical protein
VQPRRVLAVGLVVFAVIWILIDGPIEGPVLLTLNQSHGVTMADMLSVIAVFAAAVLWFR